LHAGRLYVTLAYGDKPPLKGAWSESRDLFKFWEISDNISEMVNDRDIVAMEK